MITYLDENGNKKTTTTESAWFGWKIENGEYDNDYSNLFEALLDEAINSTWSAPTRRKRIELAETLYFHYEKELSKIYEYRENEKRYKNRFIRRSNRGSVSCEQLAAHLPACGDPTIFDLPSFNDGIDYEMPKAPGLYLVGETHFNPETGEELYCIKCGSAKDLYSRQKTYLSCNPLPYYIDYCIIPPDGIRLQMEKTVQMILRMNAEAISNHAREWFFVSKDTYLEICKKGFKFFLIL